MFTNFQFKNFQLPPTYRFKAQLLVYIELRTEGREKLISHSVKIQVKLRLGS
jgi:hypothetical protein